MTSKVQFESLTPEESLETLRSRPEGLDLSEVRARELEYGANVLPQGKPVSLTNIIVRQFINPLIFILVMAAGVSLFVGDWVDAAFIGIVILINVGLGAFQEYKAEKSAESLQKLLSVSTRVRRSGKWMTLPAQDLVPGDIIALESGQKVPADARILSEQNLHCDESFLTGESLAAKKSSLPVPTGTPVTDQRCMIFAGANVTSGRGQALVTHIGAQTQVGRIAHEVSSSQAGKPPLLARMERFTVHVSWAILGAALLAAFILHQQGHAVKDIFFYVVALAVSAIPEGLPVALTVVLSIASRRMALRNVIVKRLAAVESLGSCTVIASDKTGTLTVNEQTVKQLWLPQNHVYHVTREGYHGEGELEPLGDPASAEAVFRFVRAGVLANEGQLQASLDTPGAWESHGDPVDIALLALAYKAKQSPIDIRKSYPVRAIIPYESDLAYAAASVVNHDGQGLIVIKGAPEKILPLCNSYFHQDQCVHIPTNYSLDVISELTRQGYRILALAEKNLASPQDTLDSRDLSDFCFLGLVGFIDPLRPEAKDAISQCRQAGIRVVMITGDHPRTAEAIGSQLSLPAADVFARVSPTDKLHIVENLANQGDYVAVTGDGVNDAPALRKANIGVAMGSGTDVAKDVASMIITDDRFSSLVSGIEEGRFAYDNIRKVIYLLVSCGVAEVLLFLLAISLGLPIPLLPVQLLWLNLVTNGIQHIGLAFEKGEEHAMHRPPRRPSEGIFDRLMISQTLLSGLIMAGLCLAKWIWLTQVAKVDEIQARNIILMLFVLMQNVHVFNCRSERTSAFKVFLKNNPVLIYGVLLAQGLHIGAMHTPLMQKVLRIAPLPLSGWGFMLLMALTMLGTMEVFKMLWARLEGKSRHTSELQRQN